MGLLSIAKFKEITDSVAKQYETLKDTVGDAETAGTVLYGVDQNLQRIMGLDDYDPMNALLNCSGEALTLGHPLNQAKNYCKEIITDLDNHLGGQDEWLTDNDVRVHPYYEDVAEHCGYDISPPNVFPPAIATSIGLGRITRGSPDTISDGEAVNTNLYGKANLYAQVTNVGSSSVSWTISISCKKIDNAIEGKQVTFSLASLDDKLDIGTHGVDMYVDVVSIATVSGGVTNDAISLYSETERTISL